MLRYLGPKVKKLKQLQINNQPGFSSKYSNVTYDTNKAIMSFYLKELIEKQRLKFTFSLTENSIKKYISFLNKYTYKKFSLSNLLEVRLDYTLFKLGYCSSIAQARQWIVHGHFFVNFNIIRSPSFIIKKGDIINVASTSSSIFKISKKNIYNKYIELTNCFNTTNCICLNTLISIIISPINTYYTFLKYNDSLISNYYLH